MEQYLICNQSKRDNYGSHSISIGLMEGTIKGKYITKWEEDIVRRVLVKT
jgi:hypothetical protein